MKIQGLFFFSLLINFFSHNVCSSKLEQYHFELSDKELTCDYCKQRSGIIPCLQCAQTLLPVAQQKFGNVISVALLRTSKRRSDNKIMLPTRFSHTNEKCFFIKDILSIASENTITSEILQKSEFQQPLNGTIIFHDRMRLFGLCYFLNEPDDLFYTVELTDRRIAEEGKTKCCSGSCSIQ